MRDLIVTAVVAVLAASGCAKTTCEKYADMEWRCGDYPAAEEDLTRQLAQGMCEGAKTFDGPEDRAFADQFRRESECAARYFHADRPDCGGYKACTAAIELAEPVELSP